MSKAVLTEDVREVYYAQTNEYNIKVGDKNYKVRVFEDSNGCEELLWDGENWIKDNFPEAVQNFFSLVSYGEVDSSANKGEVFDLEAAI
ncbi:hypothetical protein OAB46_00475 [bacterium]|nr:hypothetical protein [Flavobacteriaceae bacterium]MDB9780280.1 hypothetical protein [bacterium]